MTTTLYVLTGLPGSGKSTRAADIIAATGAEHVDMDAALHAQGMSIVNWDARFAFQPTVESHIAPFLRQGRSVVAEFGSWTRTERARLRHLADGTGARTELHWIDAPVATCIERIEARGGDGSKELADLLRSNASDYEKPTADEGAEFDVYVAPGERWI